MKTSIRLALATMLLAGCAGGMEPIDGQKLLSAMEGPKVPTVDDALTESAKNAERQGDYQQAAQLYAQVYQKDQNNKAVVLAMAENYRRAGDLANAIQIYDLMLEKDPASLEAKEGKALTLLAKGDFDSPGPMFQAILKEDLTRWKSLNAMGVLFITRSMQPEAQQYFAEALKHNPGSPAIWNNMGLSQALARQFDPALTSLKQAADFAGNTPQRKRIDLNTALVYATAGKLDEAGELARKYYSGAALNNNLGLYAHLAKDDQLAKAYLNMAVTESKVFYPKAWDNLQALEQTRNQAKKSETPASFESVLPPAPPPAPPAAPVMAAEPVVQPEPAVATPPPPPAPAKPALATMVPLTNHAPSAAPPADAVKKYVPPEEAKKEASVSAEDDDPLGRLIESTPAYSGDTQ